MMSESPPEHVASSTSPEWLYDRVFEAALTFWLTPRRAARHLEGVSLPTAWCGHLLAIALGVTTLLVLMTVDGHWNSLRDDLWNTLGTMEGRLALLTFGIGIETGSVVLAILLVPWMAQDEPLGETMKAACRIAWVSPSCASPCVAVCWFLFTYFLDDRSLDVAIMAVVLSLWVLWVILRAAGTPRRYRPRERPPMCEACGYNLSHLPPDRACPECGTPMVQSLGPNSRRCNAWEVRRGIGSFFSCSAAVVLRPRSFFRRMRAWDHLDRARGFLAVHAVLSGCIAGGTLAWIRLATVGALLQHELELPLMISLVYGVLAMAWTLLLAAGAGVTMRRRWERNGMLGIAKVHAYAAAVITLATLICGLTLVPLVVFSPALGAQPVWGGAYDMGQLAQWCWVLMLGGWMTFHIFVRRTGMKRIRYANA